MSTRTTSGRGRPVMTVTGLMTSLAMAAVLASPARAATDVSGDAKGDVIWVSPDGSKERLLPAAKRGDIVRVRTVHSTRAVRVWVTYRGLIPADQYLYVAVGTPKTYGGALMFHTSRADQHPDPNLYYEGSGEDWACPGAGWHISYARNRLYARVPRGCLGNPGKVHVAAAWFSHRPKGSRFDFAFLDGKRPDIAAFGPWVKAG